MGNFDFVFEELVEKSYLPFLEVLDKHPGFKMTVHYTGGLLEWLEVHRPGLLEKLRELIRRGQVEMLGGGFYEPILAVIPEADRREQVLLLTRYLKEKLGAVPRGIWLAERVWDSSIVPALVQAGIEYVLVDDYHFTCTGFGPEQLHGYYMTEEEGQALAIFPIDSRLRYLTPFQAVDKSITYLEEMASDGGGRCAIVVDDGEKYGGWPDTYDWVYTQGWLDNFLATVESHRDWIHTKTFSEILDSEPPRGRVYLPTASYFEMGQWSLPADKAVILGRAHRQMERSASLEELRPFLHGGIWKNFLVKYPESNLMHKKMLFLTQEAKKIPPSPERDTAQLAIYRAQTNDAYWHGVFGGLYLPHLRHAIHYQLLVAESLIGDGEGFRCRLFDYDRDGSSEVMVSTPVYSCGIIPHLGGHLFDWGIRPWRVNLLNTLARRFEHYHECETEPGTTPPDTESICTIHDRESASDPCLREELCYDWYPRRAFIEHFFGDSADLAGFSRSDYDEQGDFVLGEYAIQQIEPDKRPELVLERNGKVRSGDQDFEVRVLKTFHFGDKQVSVTYRLANLSALPLRTRFGVECNLSMPANNGPGGRYYLDGEEPAEPSFVSRGEDVGVSEVKLSDEVMGGIVTFGWERPAALWRFPLQTVSQSESGWEKTYQSSVLTPSWPVTLEPGGEWTMRLSLGVSV